MADNLLDELEVTEDEGAGNPEETAVAPDEGDGEGGRGKRTREVSGIEFPYVDLEQAIMVPDAIHRNLGMRGTQDHISGVMNLKGGALARRLGGARMFGLIEKDGDSYRITDVGRGIINPDHAAARIEAFLKVELYRRLYDDFRRSSLPGDAGLENHMKSLGVPAKQTENARQIFRRSARQAGFFPYGEDRLIMPVVKEEGTGSEPEKPKSEDRPPHEEPTPGNPAQQSAPTSDNPADFGGFAAKIERQMAQLMEAVRGLSEGRQDSGAVGELHPAIQGMLATLPHGTDPNEPPAWSYKRLNTWAATFTSVLKVVYEDADPEAP